MWWRIGVLVAGAYLACGCKYVGESRCKNGDICEWDGKCTTPPGILGACVAGSDADCQASRNCRTEARCTALDGACVRATDADCARHEGCKVRGLCHLVAGECVASSDADCAGATVCKGKRCEARGGWCTVVSE